MGHRVPRGGRLPLGAISFSTWGLACGVALAACGEGDNLDPYAAQGVIRPPIEVGPVQVMPAPAPPEERSDDPSSPGNGSGVANGEGDNQSGGNPSGGNPSGDGSLPTPQAADPGACATPLGVSGTPSSLSEAIDLINALPRPTSLSCFLRALSRPLDVYLTSSDQSLQPSPGARSPRAFIVYEPLVMSIVFEGEAHVTLELGYRTSARRSVKTELVFPLTTDVTLMNLFDRVREGEDTTRCGACHTGEVLTLNDDVPIDVFESDVIPPFEHEEVEIESLRGEHEKCNASREPERCELLSAFFDYGTVQPAPQGIMF